MAVYQQPGDLVTGLQLPANTGAQSFGTNTLVGAAGVFTSLPTTPITASITNPSTVYGMMVIASFGASLLCNGGAGVTAAFNVTGGVTIAASSWGIGESIHVGPAGNVEFSFAGICYVTIPAGAAAVTFEVMGARANTVGTNMVNYPNFDIVPLRWV